MKKIWLYYLFLFIIQNSYSQSNVNPDISLIGTFNTFTNNIKNTPEYGKLNFETPSMELFVDGYLNPYAKAAGNIAYEEEQFAVEELYAEIVRGLPLDMQIKAGKYLVGFGQLNIVHPHAWAFIDRPLFHQIFFSPDGFNDIGFNLSFILPTESFYSDFNIGIYKGKAFTFSYTKNRNPEEGILEENITESPLNSPIFVGRISSFFELDDYTNLAVGLSGSFGAHSKWDVHIPEIDTFGDTTSVPQATTFKYLLGGIDFKYKFKPDDYTTLTVQGEGLINNRDVFIPGEVFDRAGKISSYGGFIYIDYLFNKQYSFGAKYDYTNGIIGDVPAYNSLANDDQNTTQGISAWFGYYPVEHTLAFRLGVQHLIFSYADGTKRDPETTATLQMIFSLGPHKAHPF